MFLQYLRKYMYQSLPKDSSLSSSSSSSSSKDDLSSFNEGEKYQLAAWILYGTNTGDNDLVEFIQKVMDSKIPCEISFNKLFLPNESIPQPDELVQQIVGADLLIIVISLENQIALMQVDSEFEKQGKPPVIVSSKRKVEKADLHIMQSMGIFSVGDYEDEDILVFGEENKVFENDLLRILIKKGVINYDKKNQGQQLYQEIRK